MNKSNKNRLSKIFLSLLILLTLSLLSVNIYAMSDTTGTPYESSVSELAELGIVTGMPDGSYQPEKGLTRAEMCALISRALGEPGSSYQDQLIFWDVPATHWASGNIAFAYNLQIVNGTGAGQFSPNSTLTIPEAVTMILRTIGYKESLPILSGSWPENYLSLANEKGLLSGITVSPYSPANRGNTAIILQNALDVEPFTAEGKTLRQISQDRPFSYMQKETRYGIFVGDNFTPSYGVDSSVAIVLPNSYTEIFEIRDSKYTNSKPFDTWFLSPVKYTVNDNDEVDSIHLFSSDIQEGCAAIFNPADNTFSISAPGSISVSKSVASGAALFLKDNNHAEKLFPTSGIIYSVESFKLSKDDKIEFIYLSIAKYTPYKISATVEDIFQVVSSDGTIVDAIVVKTEGGQTISLLATRTGVLSPDSIGKKFTFTIEGKIIKSIS